MGMYIQRPWKDESDVAVVIEEEIVVVEISGIEPWI